MLANNKVLRGRYRIIQPFGQSAVYEAYDSERETNVALKEFVVDLEKASNISLREKIKHDCISQAKVLAKVKHESLPQVRGYFAEVDRHYLVMELVDGTDISEMLAKKENSPALAEITDWADQLLDTLDYLHTFAPSIIHRDINPANVKITSRGKIKLLGFSIANGADPDANLMVKNQSSAAVLNYLPLEQALRVADQTSEKKLADSYGEQLKNVLRQPIDFRSDIYALGATVYHLITGQMPVSALERAQTVWEDKADSLIAADQINPDVPPEISEVVMTAMAIEREKRFDSAAQMRQALQSAVVKVQERMAEQTKKEETAAAREALLEEEKQLEKQRQIVEQERLRIEAERQQQSELIERQLKEAEAQRTQAEERAAEAERRLMEKENPKAVENTSGSGDNYTESNQKKSVFADNNSLFAESAPEKKSSWMMPIAALAFLVITGMAAGVWFMGASSAAETTTPVIDSPADLADKITPVPVVTPTAEKPAENTAKMPAVSAAPVTQNTPKPKVAAPAPKVIRPTAAPSNKAPSNQKKAVTVDDLIGN